MEQEKSFEERYFETRRDMKLEYIEQVQQHENRYMTAFQKAGSD
jgi:hypothetical protein